MKEPVKDDAFWKEELDKLKNGFVLPDGRRISGLAYFMMYYQKPALTLEQVLWNKDIIEEYERLHVKKT